LLSIAFRQLSERDIPRIHIWLNNHSVARWYYQPDPSPAAITKKYLARARGEDPRTEHFIIEVDGQAAGVIKWYRLGDHPDYYQHLAVEAEAVSIDLFIGESAFIHKGVGPRAICKLLREVVFPLIPHKVCYIGPEQSNSAAIRAYEKAGFRHIKTVLVPGERDLIYLMRVEQEQLTEFAD
jgi:aminoglycoside 6'-N-acetyltransferase